MNYRYGLLKYSTSNIGDEIQSIAARQFLPRVDVYVDRDYLQDVRSRQRIKLIMNGFFLSQPKNWPPSSDIAPLFVSFHMAEQARRELTSDKSIAYFKQHEPIGCRDYFTQELLAEKGVQTYFSGCLTFTLGRHHGSERTDEILLTDLDEEVMKDIPPHISAKSVVLSHGHNSIAVISSRLYRLSPVIHKTVKTTKLHVAWKNAKMFLRSAARDRRRVKRYEQAEAVLDRYAKAKLVITSRLHSALPCLAFDTPVIFVNKNLNDPRFTGLLEYMRSYSVEEFKYKGDEIDVENPEPNPKSIDELRENLIKTCEEFISNR